MCALSSTLLITIASAIGSATGAWGCGGAALAQADAEWANCAHASAPTARCEPICFDADSILRINVKPFQEVAHPDAPQNGRSSPQKAASVLSTKNASVLGSGTWIKVSVAQSGIHRIGYNELVEWGLRDVERVSVWGNGGGALPIDVAAPCPDDLEPIPIHIERGADGVFGPGDYLLFYAEGPQVATYNHSAQMWIYKQHDYSTAASYFVTTEQPQRLIATAPESPPPTHTTNEYDALAMFEPNDTNLVKSGREWFGDMFDYTTRRTYNTQLNRPAPSSTMRIWVRVASTSNYPTQFSVDVNSTPIGTMPMPALPLANYADVASVSSQTFSLTAPSTGAVVGLSYQKSTPTDVGWLGFVAVNSRQLLRYDNRQLIFWDALTAQPGQITQFNVQDAPSDMAVWDISHINHALSVPIANGSFALPTDTLRRFVAFRPSDALSVHSPVRVPNQNLHAMGQPNMVIVAHPMFMEQSESLAELHREHDGLTVAVVSAQQVYNEFSSGNPDASAIRNLMRMLYRRAPSPSERPRYLLLFGDGSYNNRSTAANNTNLLPTFQSENSISPVKTYVCDDYFGLLDDGDADELNLNGQLDLGVGRIPAHNAEQANIAVSKIRSYMASSTDTCNTWQNILCFVGDDEDNNLHMNDANRLADYVMLHHPEYAVQKILLDAYRQEVTSLGQSYPEATRAINSRMNNGALLLNYTGHANERWITSEKVLMINDIQNWQNLNALPLIITATCEFSRFDNYLMLTAGEHALFSKNGGAIALLSTTRPVYSNPNYMLNLTFIRQLFERDEQGRRYALGDLMRLSKNSLPNDVNKLNFTLLGDPALRLRYPTHRAELLSINGIPVEQPHDTLRALDRVELTGHVCSSSGTTQSGFNGTVHIVLYDKPDTVTTLANDGGEPMEFVQQHNVLFSGCASVSDGLFSIDFTMPKDINFNPGRTKIALFASDGKMEAMGAYTDVVVGGINPSSPRDTRGPDIRLRLNGMDFNNGGICNPNPVLEVLLSDESGINTTGIGIGHDFMATLSGTNDHIGINLNGHYKAELDNPRRGRAIYRFSNLSEGSKTLKVKVWDIFNNSSEAQIQFTVTSSGSLVVQALRCLPNPVSDQANFYFDHNQSQSDFNVDLRIFSITGTLVHRSSHAPAPGGAFRVGPIRWDGTDQRGNRVPSGVYIAHLIIGTPDGQRASLQQKLVVIKQ